MKKDFDITKTKLVIWDLDETFWDGTLSEGSIKFNPEHLQLVEDLTLKGIMTPISHSGLQKILAVFSFSIHKLGSKGRKS